MLVCHGEEGAESKVKLGIFLNELEEMSLDRESGHSFLDCYLSDPALEKECKMDV